jgi:hypothetical protein
MKALLVTMAVLCLVAGSIGCCTYNCVRDRFCSLHNKFDTCCEPGMTSTYLSPPVIQE